jgi:predicted RNase H-like HicB family nuclease
MTNLPPIATKWTVAFDFDDIANTWGAVVLDLPGCTSGGDTFAQARTNVAQAIALHVSEIMKDEGSAPAPIGLAAVLDQAETDADLREQLVGATVLEVEAGELRSRAVRIQITMNENLLAMVDREAARLESNRSAFLAIAARRYLHAEAA